MPNFCDVLRLPEGLCRNFTYPPKHGRARSWNGQYCYFLYYIFMFCNLVVKNLKTILKHKINSKFKFRMCLFNFNKNRFMIYVKPCLFLVPTIRKQTQLLQYRSTLKLESAIRRQPVFFVNMVLHFAGNICCEICGVRRRAYWGIFTSFGPNWEKMVQFLAVIFEIIRYYLFCRR